jgi:hypothetical protein
LRFIGDDRVEDHHDVEVQDETGRMPAAVRLPEGVEGIARLHEPVAKHGGDNLDPGEVVVSIETDRGPWVQSLLATGYPVYAVNPKRAARFKERYGTSGAESDKGDAHALADMVRIDRDQMRPIAGGSEHFPAALNAYADLSLTSTDAMELLVKAPMFRHDPGIILYAQLRTAIYKTAVGHVQISIDQPSTKFATASAIPRIAEVGAQLDAKVAELLRLMSLPVPPELTTA